MNAILGWLQDTAAATAIREGSSLFPWIECVHVLAITLVVGSIAVVDLRLLGVSSLDRPVSHLSAEILPLTWTAFLVAAISGFLLFISKAVAYGANLSFQLKLACIILAGLNMLVFQFSTFRRVGSWDAAAQPPPAARLAGAVSLSLWIAVVVCGRIIGFTTVVLPP